MEQTFNDLYNEQKRYTNRGFFSFVFWMFIETALGIIKENILLFTQGNAMRNILTNLRWPASISFTLVLPFMILELVNRRSFNEGFPVTLFGILWLLPTIFILTLMSIVRNLQRAGNSILVNPITLVLRVIFLAIIIWMSAGILIDQMPCFLGVPNCD